MKQFKKFEKYPSSMDVKDVKKAGHKLGEWWKKFWNLLWKDDSLKGWVFSLIFMFVFIKFILFPALSLVTGTALPLAIVESCSMYHKGNVFSSFGNWWERHDEKYFQLNITESEFKNFAFKRGFSKGDILFIIKANPEKLKVGDIIIFEAGQKNPIIHRIMGVKEENGKYIFSTIGDNNNGQLSFEGEIDESRLMGKAIFRIVPYFGWAKLVFFENARPFEERGFCEEN